MRKFILALAAAGSLLGLSIPASALTYGTIPQGSQANEGVNPIYGTSSRGGWYGAALSLVAGSGGANLTFTFLGSEAGYNNSFWFRGIKLFETGGNTNPGGIFNAAGIATTTINSVASGLLDFYFMSPLGTAVNGSNPDDGLGLGNVGPNFFISFDGDPTSSGGTSLVLWFDDNGADNDDNHDDMAIRISITNGVASVPVPAALPLMLVGLGGLGLMRLRRKKSA